MKTTRQMLQLGVLVCLLAKNWLEVRLEDPLRKSLSLFGDNDESGTPLIVMWSGHFITDGAQIITQHI